MCRQLYSLACSISWNGYNYGGREKKKDKNRKRPFHFLLQPQVPSFWTQIPLILLWRLPLQTQRRSTNNSQWWINQHHHRDQHYLYLTLRLSPPPPAIHRITTPPITPTTLPLTLPQTSKFRYRTYLHCFFVLSYYSFFFLLANLLSIYEFSVWLIGEKM